MLHSLAKLSDRRPVSLPVCFLTTISTWHQSLHGSRQSLNNLEVYPVEVNPTYPKPEPGLVIAQWVTFEIASLPDRRLISFFMQPKAPEGLTVDSSPLSVLCSQTPPAAAGSPGLVRRRAAPPSRRPETPPSLGLSPSWCRPPPGSRCEIPLQHWRAHQHRSITITL